MSNDYLPFGRVPDDDQKITIPLARYDQLLRAEYFLQAILMTDDKKKDRWDRGSSLVCVIDTLFLDEPEPMKKGENENAECSGNSGQADG